MNKRYLLHILVLILVLTMGLNACREDEDEQTPSPGRRTPEPIETPVIQAADTPSVESPDSQEPDAEITYDWEPQLVYSAPTIGEEALLDGAITLRFDQPMDQQSVESAFRVSLRGKTSSVDGSFMWPESHTMIFTPENQLERKQAYEVVVLETARAQTGKGLREEINLLLETVGYLEVSQVIPASGTENVQTDTGITVVFNRPVVPLVATGQQAELPQPLSFTPNIIGEGEWVSTSIYRFTPTEALASSTRYEVAVNSGLQDITGGELVQAHTWEFSTLPPSVVTTTPELNESGIIPTEPITITFNTPMDQASTAAASLLSPETPVDYVWSDQNRTLTLIPQQSLALDEAYTLEIGRSARSMNGQASLDRTYSIRFTTIPFPAVLRTDPSDGSVAHQFQRGVNIIFASPMDFSTIEDNVLINPEPGDTTYYYNDYDNSVYISFDLDRDTLFTITVPGSAADPYGNTLGEDYTWQFRTPEYEPLVSMNLPHAVSQFSTSHPSDINVIYRNISRIDAALYDAGLPASLLVYRRTQEFPPSPTPLRNWSIPVEKNPEAANVQPLSLADGGTLETGVYYLNVTSPEIVEDQTYWQNQENLLIVADTNIIVKEMFDRVYVWVTNLETGLPAANVNLTLYNRHGTQIGSAISDDNGLANFTYTPSEDYLEGVLVVSNSPGQEGFGIGSSEWNDNVTPWEFGLNYAWGDAPERFGYLHTDRPIYRPGDTVYFRGIVRDNAYGRYPLPTDETVTLALEYSTNYETLEYEFEASLDENGEFSGEYVIPENSSLGTYRFYFIKSDIEASRQFTVAQYRKPEFQVFVTPETEETLRGEAVEVKVDASYFFGGPATDLAVNWSVSEQDYFLHVDGLPYNFGDSADFFYEPGGPFNFGQGGFSGNVILNGQGVTDANGELTIQLPADFLEDVEPGSRRVTFEATLFDITSFPVSARSQVIFHAADDYVGIRPVDYFGTAEQELEVDLITVNWDGITQPEKPVEVVYYQREWVPNRDQQFGQYYTRWEVQDTEVDRDEIETDELGKARSSFTPMEGGIYIAVATITDSSNRSQLSSTMVWVADREYGGWRSDPRAKRMDLVADLELYQPGDTARVLVQSPFEGPVEAWLTIERGTLIEQREITLRSTSDTIEIPITQYFAPNVHVTIHAVKGIDDSNQFADMRIGIVELIVSTEHLGINLDIEPQDELYSPGGAAIFEIQATDYQGNPVQADISLALVDLAVLTLKDDNAPDILEGFYARQPIRSQTGSGLVISGEDLEIEIPTVAPGLGGGGGGFADEASLALTNEEDEGVRQDFKDTAYWDPKVTTDESGSATAEIPLPDNITTWRLSSKAVSDYQSSDETLVGQSSVDIISTLPLLIRPVTPRFFRVGDVLFLGAVIHNNTGELLEVATELDAIGLTLADRPIQNVEIASGGSKLVRWEVTVDDVSFADITFRAEAGDYSDATKPTFGIAPDQLIPVVRYTGEDIVGTSGTLDEAGRRVEAILLPEEVDPRQGEISIQLTASLAGVLLEALEITNEGDIQPECAHALADRLLPNAATLTAIYELDLEFPGLAARLESHVSRDVASIENLQKSDGGWGWCHSEKSDPRISAAVLLSLAKAGEAGFDVSDRVIRLATDYLADKLRSTAQLHNGSDVNRQAYFLYILSEFDAADLADMDELFEEHRSLMDPYAKALLALAFDQLNGRQHLNSLLADLSDEVILSAGGAHWEDAIPDWDNLNSDIRGTAIVVNTLTSIDPDNAITPNAIRWLTVARQAGHWPSGQDNAWSIMALSNWLLVSGELDADYTYQVFVNSRELGGGNFNETNVADIISMAVPVSRLSLADVNFVDLSHGSGDGRLYYTAYLDSFINADGLEPINRGFSVDRRYYDASCDPKVTECLPIDSIEIGQQVRVELTIVTPSDQVFVIVEDPLPSGAEAIDPGLETSASGLGGSMQAVADEFPFGYWGWWYFDRIEYRDDKVVFLSEFLPAGTYQYTYTMNATIPGDFQVAPTTARMEFFPEVFSRSSGQIFAIDE